MLAQPDVICALTGPSTFGHLEENLGGAGWAIDAADLAALERFLNDEDQRLRDEQIAELTEILQAEAPSAQAFADFLYTLETLVELGLAEEQEVMPAFQQLWGLRGSADPSVFTHIQADLRKQFLTRLNDHEGWGPRRKRGT